MNKSIENDLIAALTGKLPKPPPCYKGNRLNDACIKWLIRLEQYLAIMNTITPLTETQKIVYGAQLLSNEALLWWSTSYKEWVADLAHNQASFEGWKQKLLERFGDPRSAMRRREEWESLKQTGTVKEWHETVLAKGEKLIPTVTEYQLYFRFRSGLKPYLLESFSLLGDVPIPETLPELYAYCSNAEFEFLDNQKGAKSLQSSGNISSTPSQSQKSLQTPTYSLNAAQLNENIKAAHRAKAEYNAKCRRERLCYRCGQAGHKKRDCTWK